MKKLWSIICLLIFLLQVNVSVGQKKSDQPVITGQTPSPLSTLQGTPITITLANLIVTPANPTFVYPDGFTLEVGSEKHYKFSGTTVTPDLNFTGLLKVRVRVIEGNQESKWYDLKVNVIASATAAPRITGQTPVTINQGQNVTITFAHLTVTDSDSNYPSGFTLTVYNGNNYTINGTTVTPAPNFSGVLKVQVSVNDGENESNRFDFKIEVLKPENTAPKITGQQTLTVNEDESITIKLTDLIVNDPDSNFPQDFTLEISKGPHYSNNGNTVVPDKNYSGTLSVKVKVNDGKKDSPSFDLQITVVPVNDGPLITGQKKLSADQGTPFSISLSDLTVTDPDNKYPDDFKLEILKGNNYVAAGSTINPSPTFVGTLTVIVSVNDGTASSPEFNVQVEIVDTKKNVAPTIVGQKAISITQNTSITLQLFHLLVNDPDNEFPAGFSIKVFPGSNYTVIGTKVTPANSFVNGMLSVGVRVNDGSDDSPLFELKIQVTPISATPRINGQKELSVMEDNAITINLSDLFVTDADNPNYPQGFSLRVLPDGEGVYTVKGNAVTPGLNLNGFIEVRVTVSDGINTSAQFGLAILVTPVNDAPLITQVESSPLSYEPGTEPAEVFRRLTLADVDNEYLTMAEIGFRDGHSPENDELLIDENPNIRAIKDPSGILFLIGNATVVDYQAAMRSLKYNYRLTEDPNGKPDDIVSAPRTIYVNVFDGEDISLTSERIVNLEAKIALDIPSAFTPNGDNANDTWHFGVSGIDILERATIKVYNKRGLLVYGSDGFEKEWDGMFNGERLPSDTYYYTIVVKLPYTRQTYSGVVTILY